MIIHYLKITCRSLLRRSGYSTINLLGLTVGLAAFIFIFQFVSFETGFNQDYHNLDRLHRVLMVGSEETNLLSPAPLATVAEGDLSEIQGYSRILDYFDGTITFPHPETGSLKTFVEAEAGVYADGNLLDLLGYSLSKGQSPKDPYTVAISESKARYYFDTLDPIGQTLTLHNEFGKQLYTITGIYPDLPAQSDLQFDLLFSIKSFENLNALNQRGWAWLGNWDSWSYQTIFLLNPEAKPQAVEAALNQYRSNLSEAFAGSIALQALSELHLGGGPNASTPSSANARYINFFLLLGFLILAIAWINYVNLSVAQSLQKIKAIGVQRIVGAQGRQIWGQYLVEALVFNVLAMIMALLLVVTTQEFVNQIIGRPLAFSQLKVSWMLMGGLAFLLLGALCSGIYVAIVLTAFHPMNAIKGIIRNPGKKDWVRRSMLIFQFSISTGLIIGTGFMLRQLHFMQDKELGAQLDQVLLVPGPQILGEAYEGSLAGFQNSLAQVNYLEEISFSGMAPGEGYSFQGPNLRSQYSLPDDDGIIYSSTSIDDHYLSLYNIPILAGRNFRPEEVTSFYWYDIDKVVLNEKAVELLRFESPEMAIGQTIHWSNDQALEVVGVVQDHHHMGLQEEIKPMVFLGSENFGLLGLKLNTDDLDNKIAGVGALYKEHFPGNPFQYFFADENFALQYDAQKQTASLFGLACGLAVFIACLGLLGLSIATVKQRTKEVGVRRVLGATASQVVLLLSRDYLLQVLFSFLLVIPLVSYFMQQWLQDFAYRIELDWWVFALGGLSMLVVALLTTGGQALKAAFANPVDSLKNE